MEQRMTGQDLILRPMSTLAVTVVFGENCERGCREEAREFGGVEADSA
jgi:hypothetical protein